LQTAVAAPPRTAARYFSNDHQPGLIDFHGFALHHRRRPATAYSTEVIDRPGIGIICQGEGEHASWSSPRRCNTIATSPASAIA
jgi:hypothetical protein